MTMNARIAHRTASLASQRNAGVLGDVLSYLRQKIASPACIALALFGLPALPAAQVEEVFSGRDAFHGSPEIEVDAAGNVFVAGLRSVFRITPQGAISQVLSDVGEIDELAVGDDGSVYVSLSDGQVLKRTPAGAVLSEDLSGAGSQTDLVVDSVGNAYTVTFSVFTGAHLHRLSFDGLGSSVHLSTCLSLPTALVVDHLDNVYVMIQVGRILKISPALEVTVALGCGGSKLLGLWNYPGDLGVDENGNLYVAGRESDSVIRVAPDGTTSEIIDGLGDGAGAELEVSWGVAVDGVGNVYVTGNATDNVFKVTPAGIVTEIADELGAGPGARLDKPTGLTVDSAGNVYVVGSESKNVLRVEPGGAVIEILGPAGAGTSVPILEPRALATDSSGTVYVVSWANNRVYQRTPSGVTSVLIDITGDGSGNSLRAPNDVAVDALGNVFVASQHGIGSVFRIEPDGAITVVIDENAPDLNGIHSLALDREGGVYVTGEYSDTVLRVTPSGAVTEIIGPAGVGSSPLEAPRAIATDLANNVYVAGFLSSNVFRISPAGVITEIISSSGDGISRLVEPSGLAVDGAGNVYVTGSGSDNVFRISPSGVITRIADRSSVGADALESPLGVAVTAAGTVIVAGTGSDNVLAVDSAGSIKEIVHAGSVGLGAFEGAWDVVTDVFGNIYVSGAGSDNVLKITAAECVQQPSVSFRNAGTNPASYTATPASIGQDLTFTVNLATTGHETALVFGFDSPFNLALGGGQTLLCFDLQGSGGDLINTDFASGPLATFSLAVPPNAALTGSVVSTQALHAFGVVPFALSNAQDVVIGGCR